MIKCYCGNCDDFFEIHEYNVFKEYSDSADEYINIRCPRCGDYEELPID